MTMWMRAGHIPYSFQLGYFGITKGMAQASSCTHMHTSSRERSGENQRIGHREAASGNIRGNGATAQNSPSKPWHGKMIPARLHKVRACILSL